MMTSAQKALNSGGVICLYPRVTTRGKSATKPVIGAIFDFQKS